MERVQAAEPQGQTHDLIQNLVYYLPVKAVVFVGSSVDDLRAFPTAARQRAGYQLHLVQEGHDSTDWKPMASIGPGCREIRVRVGQDAYRVIYVASFGDAVYVLHCFEKKSQQSPKSDIELARQRYKKIKESIQ